MASRKLLHVGLLRQHGFNDVTVESIRKRNSKKELFEFVIGGKFSEWPWAEATCRQPVKTKQELDEGQVSATLNP